LAGGELAGVGAAFEAAGVAFCGHDCFSSNGGEWNSVNRVGDCTRKAGEIRMAMTEMETTGGFKHQGTKDDGDGRRKFPTKNTKNTKWERDTGSHRGHREHRGQRGCWGTVRGHK
jgi:hypothetical protein